MQGGLWELCGGLCERGKGVEPHLVAILAALLCRSRLIPRGLVSSTHDSPRSRGGDTLPSRDCGGDRLPSFESASSRSPRLPSSPPSSVAARASVASVVCTVRLNTQRALLFMVSSGAARVAEPFRVMKGGAGGVASVAESFRVSSGAASVAELACSAPFFDSGCSEPLLAFGGAEPLLDVDTLLFSCAEPLLDVGCAESLLDDGCAEPLLDPAWSEPGGGLFSR
eukprot:scaffold22310_cov59-Phaeocystis_antarctica.AAC.2